MSFRDCDAWSTSLDECRMAECDCRRIQRTLSTDDLLAAVPGLTKRRIHYWRTHGVLRGTVAAYTAREEVLSAGGGRAARYPASEIAAMRAVLAVADSLGTRPAPNTDVLRAVADAARSGERRCSFGAITIAWDTP